MRRHGPKSAYSAIASALTEEESELMNNFIDWGTRNRAFFISKIATCRADYPNDMGQKQEVICYER